MQTDWCEKKSYHLRPPIAGSECSPTPNYGACDITEGNFNRSCLRSTAFPIPDNFWKASPDECMVWFDVVSLFTCNLPQHICSLKWRSTHIAIGLAFELLCSVKLESTITSYTYPSSVRSVGEYMTSIYFWQLSLLHGCHGLHPSRRCKEH